METLYHRSNGNENHTCFIRAPFMRFFLKKKKNTPLIMNVEMFSMGVFNNVCGEEVRGERERIATFYDQTFSMYHTFPIPSNCSIDIVKP